MRKDARLLQEGGLNFCYSDESGTGQEPIATMVGILVDSGRMHLTKEGWSELLAILSKLTGHPVRELHTADFYSGNGVWRVFDGPERADWITAIFNWLAERKHHVVYSAVLKSSYFNAVRSQEIPDELNSLWRFLAFHLTLAVQKYSQPEPKNKGNTLLIFDNEESEERRFIDIVSQPPKWSDTYYGRKKKQRQLDQIIDVPMFGDSKDLPLLQVSDFLAFFLRRHAEVQEGLVTTKYPDEKERLTSWFSQLTARSIGSQHIYPKRPQNKAQKLFNLYAPPSISL